MIEYILSSMILFPEFSENIAENHLNRFINTSLSYNKDYDFIAKYHNEPDIVEIYKSVEPINKTI